jgi:oxygen-independent coproporphyrinogen-3 oxidase
VTDPAHWRDLGPGIYLHIPFCRRRCGYCDFASTTGDAAARNAFVADLLAEIRLVAAGGDFADETFRTIFLGGGTPSLLEGDQMNRILGALRDSFAVTPDAEVTMEANPESLEPERLDAFLRGGGNRVSLGIQSLDDAALRLLDRAHDAALARHRAGELKERRVSFSVDLIYGLPGLDTTAWGTALDGAIELGADHLSAYLLTLEPGTPMHVAVATGELTLPGEEEARAQYELLVDRTSAAGLSCYEISNFARPGLESRHNQNYWVRGEYLGLGPSAHSHHGGWRWANEPDPGAWSRAVQAGGGASWGMPREAGGSYREMSEAADCPILFRERVSGREAAAEWIFLGLRRTEGVPWDLLATAAGDGAAALERRTGFLAEQGLLERQDGWLRLARAGRFVSDAIFADLMAAMEDPVPVDGTRR